MDTCVADQDCDLREVEDSKGEVEQLSSEQHREPAKGGGRGKQQGKSRHPVGPPRQGKWGFNSYGVQQNWKP